MPSPGFSPNWQPFQLSQDGWVINGKLDRDYQNLKLWILSFHVRLLCWVLKGYACFRINWCNSRFLVPLVVWFLDPTSKLIDVQYLFFPYRIIDIKFDVILWILQTVTRVKPYICTMPLKLDEGWNQIQLNLADFTRRAYGTNYVETLRVQVHANCRLRRIYFSDRLYSEEELPPEFKLYLPVQQVRIPSSCLLYLGGLLLIFHLMY